MSENVAGRSSRNEGRVAWFTGLLSVFLAVPVGFLALLVSGVVLWTVAVFFFRLFTKPNLIMGLGQLMICAIGIWFVYSLIAVLLGKRGGWLVFLGLAGGFAALTPLIMDISRSFSGRGLYGQVRSLRVSPAVCVVIFGGWLSTGLLLAKSMISGILAAVRK